MLSRVFTPGTLVKHFKGNLYSIVCMAVSAETGERLVIYRAEYGENTVYARSYDEFISLVDTKKYPLVTQKYRFEIV